MTSEIKVPKIRVAEYVADVARRHGVSYIRTSNDALADRITQLSGDEVETDVTEDLIVSLRRSKVINGTQMVELLGNHMEEVKHVRSI
jgi:hypothetical protein